MKRTACQWLAVSSVVVVLVAMADARTRPHYGGTLRMQTRGDAAQVARGMILDTLTRVDNSGNAQPYLAARWLSQNDGTRWQFWLRPGIEFHDGTALTPAAVVQSLAASCNGTCPWRTVRVLGDSVLFESDQPISDLAALLALEKYAIARNVAGTSIGTGPFRVQALATDTLVLTAYDDAWSGRPFVDTVEIRGGRSIRDQWMDAGVGRADLVEVPAEQLRRAQQERMSVSTSRFAELIATRVEPSSSVLQDQRVRAALALTFDRGALFNVIFQKQGEVTASVLPSWMSGYSFLFQSTANVSRARELRSQAPRGGVITLAVDPADSTLQLVAERLALNARDAGFQIQVVPDNGNHAADMKVERVALESSDPAVVLRSFGGKAEPLPDEQHAESLYRAERDLLQQYTVIPLLYVPRGFAVNGRVHGFGLSAVGEPIVADAWMESGK